MRSDKETPDLGLRNLTPDQQLEFAVRHNELEMARHAIAQGADVNMEITSGQAGKQPALCHAIAKGFKEIARLLMDDPQIEIDKPSLSGRTPLVVAIEAGDYESFTRLLERNANVDGNNQYPAPIICASSPFLKTVDEALRLKMTQDLVEYGADLRATTNIGATCTQPHETALEILENEAPDSTVAAYLREETQRQHEDGTYLKEGGDDNKPRWSQNHKPVDGGAKAKIDPKRVKAELAGTPTKPRSNIDFAKAAQQAKRYLP